MASDNIQHNIHPIAKLIADNGVENFKSQMFSEEQKKDILGQAAELLFRQGKFNDAIVALEMAGLPLPKDKIREAADKKMLLNKYEEAYFLLAKIEDQQMADFIKANFLK